jgi:hypothetical protein
MYVIIPNMNTGTCLGRERSCHTLTDTQEATHLLKLDVVLRLTKEFFLSVCCFALLRLLCSHMRVYSIHASRHQRNHAFQCLKV